MSMNIVTHRYRHIWIYYLRFWSICFKNHSAFLFIWIHFYSCVCWYIQNNRIIYLDTNVVLWDRKHVGPLHVLIVILKYFSLQKSNGYLFLQNLLLTNSNEHLWSKAISQRITHWCVVEYLDMLNILLCM